jgi:hypothetical protein
MSVAYNDNEIWNDGPDNLHPSNSHLAIKLTDAVKLRINDNDYYTPLSIYSIFRNTVNEKPNHPALGEKMFLKKFSVFNRFKFYLAYKVESRWISLSYLEYWKTCLKVAKSFIKVRFEIKTKFSFINFFLKA